MMGEEVLSTSCISSVICAEVTGVGSKPIRRKVSPSAGSATTLRKAASIRLTVGFGVAAGAYMTTFIGRKKFYMICVVLFGVSSAMCGLAPSLPLLVFFRILQGMGGGGLAPSEQAILADTFPPAKRGQANQDTASPWGSA